MICTRRAERLTMRIPLENAQFTEGIAGIESVGDGEILPAAVRNSPSS
jgi:hypothetical protein